MNIIQNNQKKAVIYCRVSTKEQVDEGNSLVTQEKICREYALKNEFAVSEIFIEEGESAKTIDRTKLQQLLAYCSNKKNGISVIIIYKIDRLSRNTDDYSQIRLLLKRYSVEIKSVTEYFENTPAGRFMENIISNVAQFDNDVRAERCSGGMRDAMKEGRYVWQAPIGYDNIRIENKTTIDQNKKLAPFVLKTFELIAENLGTLEDVRKKMMKEGLATKSGRALGKSYFYRLIRNPLYAGWIIKFGERHKGTFKPIVSEELFNQVQYVLKYKGRKNTQYLIENPDFPLRRFVRHPSGLQLTGGWSKGRTQKYPYYRFGIKGFNYPRKTIEDSFKEFLEQYCIDKRLYGKLEKYARGKLTKALENRNQEVNQLENYIISLKEKRGLLIQKNLDKVIDNEVLQEQLEKIQNELFHTEKALSNLPHIKIGIEKLLAFLNIFLNTPSQIWENVKPEIKKQFQWFNFPKGIIFDGNEFRTEELACIYRVKETILHPLTPIVDSRVSNLNQKGKNTFENIDSPMNSELIFWSNVYRECEQLDSILNKEKLE